VDDPLYQLLRPLFPDYRAQDPGFWPLHVAWVAILVALLFVGAQTARRQPTPAENNPTERFPLRDTSY
jgi:hypothetical protein